MRRFLRDQGLSLVFLALFLGSLAGQSVAGHNLYNEEARQHGESVISFGRYLVSSDFANAVMENWQSEYLQFVTFLIVTVWIVQRGSTESKEPGKEGRESDEQQQVGAFAEADSPRWVRAGGWRLKVYENSLLIVMGVIWIGSWFAQSVTGWTVFNDEQAMHGQPGVSYLTFLGSSSFWEATLENWQSEFLAVGSMIVLTIYLRQRGSPQSKPVGAAHHETAVEG
jgi:hypothetical protein